MNFSFSILNGKRKLENAIIFSVIVFLLKIVLPTPDNLFSFLFNEILIYGLLYFWYVYLIGVIRGKSEDPLSIIFNIGILGAKIFILFLIASLAFGSVVYASADNGLMLKVISALIGGVFIGSGLYIFSSFRVLFFLRQKKDPKFYFTAMIYFLSGVYISGFFKRMDFDLSFISNSFYVVAIVLISINSIRVAWIAFLSKKQKLYLIAASVLLSAIFGISFGLTLDESNLLNRILTDFSPGVQDLLNLLMLYGTIHFGVIFFTALFHLPTAEAFDRKAEEVSSLADFSKMITQVFDFNELADTVTATTKKVCNSDLSWLAIKGDDGFEVISVHNIGFAEANKVMTSILLENSYSIEEVRILNERSVKIRFGDSVRYLRFESVAVAPLKIHSTINGYLFAGNLKYYVFDDDDKKAIGAFADFAAVALENSLLFKESIEKERLEKELDVAREIQSKIIPENLPKISNLEISTAFVPAFEVGGDYFDFFEIGESKLAFVIADVSGKGISAAFIMAEVKGIFGSLAYLIDKPKEVLKNVNDILSKSLTKKDFVTAIYGILDAEKGILTFSRAGHSPLIVVSGDKGRQYSPKGLGLGVERTGRYASFLDQMEINLNNNDIVCLFTDGITEAQNENYYNYGIERFQNLLIKNSYLNMEQLANVILQDISLYSKDHSQHDDITLILFKWVNNKTNGED